MLYAVIETNVLVSALLKMDSNPFAELAMFFEEHNVQFVAVMKEINIATSSGRMRLNILMTFTHMSKRSFQNVPVISSQ